MKRADNYSILLDQIPFGYSEGMYEGKRYGIRKESFSRGNSLKVYAHELGGTDFISCNLYDTSKEKYLRPCEMSEEKVIEFLTRVERKI